MGNTFLVVDDAPFIREIIISCLTQEGHTCLGDTSSGVEVVSMIEKLKPDYVFLDLVLPQKNGLQIAQEIFEKGQNVKIVGVTALDIEWNVITKESLNYFYQVIKKPFTKQQLLQVFSSSEQQRESA